MSETFRASEKMRRTNFIDLDIDRRMIPFRYLHLMTLTYFLRSNTLNCNILETARASASMWSDFKNLAFIQHFSSFLWCKWSLSCSCRFASTCTALFRCPCCYSLKLTGRNCAVFDTHVLRGRQSKLLRRIAARCLIYSIYIVTVKLKGYISFK